MGKSTPVQMGNPQGTGIWEGMFCLHTRKKKISFFSFSTVVMERVRDAISAAWQTNKHIEKILRMQVVLHIAAFDDSGPCIANCHCTWLTLNKLKDSLRKRRLLEPKIRGASFYSPLSTRSIKYKYIICIRRLAPPYVESSSAICRRISFSFQQLRFIYYHNALIDILVNWSTTSLFWTYWHLHCARSK